MAGEAAPNRALAALLDEAGWSKAQFAAAARSAASRSITLEPASAPGGAQAVSG